MLHQDIDDLNMHRAMDLRRRFIPSEQLLKFEGYMSEIFEAMGVEQICDTTTGRKANCFPSRRKEYE